MSDSLLYFAYGSNMALERLHGRVPDAQPLSNGILPRHSLRFHKIGRDGSAKCDAFATGQNDDRVHGMLFRMLRSSRALLDEAEGLGRGYDIRAVLIELPDGSSVEAFAYFATLIDPALKPFDWYLEHVLRGARQARLPAHYIETLRLQACLPDPDPVRAARERALY